jgi:hypothetical protein
MSEIGEMQRLQHYDGTIGTVEGVVGDLYRHVDSEVTDERSGNPILRYEKPGYVDVFRKLLEEIEGRFESESPLGKILESRRRASIQKLEAIDAIGTPAFTERCKRYFQNAVPKEEEVERAKTILQSGAVREDCMSGEMINAKWLRNRMRSYLTGKGLGREWKVGIIHPRGEKRVSRLCTDKPTRSVRIRNDYREAQRNAESSVVHEAGGHILQWENGLKQPLPNTFFHGIDGRSVRTSEGLALVMEEKDGYGTDARRRAAYVVAVDAALRGASYMDVVKLMKNDYEFPEDESRDIAQRVKRGLSDTSKGGGFPKDVVYLLGSWDVEGYSEKGGDLKNLYVGNVPLEEMGVIQQLVRDGVLKKPRYLPDCLLK